MNLSKSVCRFTRLFPIAVIGIALFSSAFFAAGARAAEPSQETRFYLVGVGPGDPDLITLRAIRVIEKADVVYVSPGVAQRFANLLEGKQVIAGYWHLFPFYGVDPEDVPANQRREYERITTRRNALIAQVRKAVAEGKTVVIADCGDPLIYGPWAWTLEEFADLHPVVVPGLSCFNAGNAALGCSITSGKNTKSVILTADDWPGMTDTIEELSKLHTTMVLFTMKADFEKFINKLRINLPADTPVAIVQHAGYAKKQRVVTGTLGTIDRQVDGRQLPFEYMIYVGDFLHHRSKSAAEE